VSTAGEAFSLQQAVTAVYQWLLGGEPQPQLVADAIQTLAGSPLSVEDLRRLGERLQSDRAFMAMQRRLVQKWRERMESPQELSEDAARELFQDVFQSFDHALLYEHGIRASSTSVVRDSFSDMDIRAMPCWTLHLTLSGSALFLSEQMEHRTRAGDMMLLRADARYHYGLHPRSASWEHLWALFQPRAQWHELLDWRALDRGIFLLSLPSDESRTHLERLFRELIALSDGRSPLQAELQYNKLEEMLLRARSYCAAESDPALDPRIRLACEYMLGRLAERFRIEEVAAACNLSASRLAHLFSAQMGMGPKAWINDMRLQQARKLLLDTPEGIGVIAARVGYDDAPHFTRHFRRSVGCSPSQFRESFRGRRS